MEQGWECIKCHNVYAPNMPFCLYCWFQSNNNNNNNNNITINNTNSSNEIQEELTVQENIIPEPVKTTPILEQTNKNLSFQKVECNIPVLNKNPTYPKSENYPDTKIYLAGIGHSKERAIARKFEIPYILDSIIDFPVQPSQLVRKYFNHIKSISQKYLLDSGAFTYMMNPKKPLDLNAHVNQYCYYINEFDIQDFFELDLDVFMSIEDIENIRRKIYLETHKKPIIVYHIERGHDYWINMCKENEFVAIGGIASSKLKEGTVDYKIYSNLVEEAHLYGTRVHGLGFTPLILLNSRTMFFDTVDSTSWNATKYGCTSYINEKGELVKVEGSKFFSATEGQENDLRIWAQFSKDYRGRPRKETL